MARQFADLVKMLGGEIWLESEGENQGSVVSFTLPIAMPESAVLQAAD